MNVVYDHEASRQINSRQPCREIEDSGPVSFDMTAGRYGVVGKGPHRHSPKEPSGTPPGSREDTAGEACMSLSDGGSFQSRRGTGTKRGFVIFLFPTRRSGSPTPLQVRLTMASAAPTLPGVRIPQAQTLSRICVQGSPFCDLRCAQLSSFKLGRISAFGAESLRWRHTTSTSSARI